MGLRRLILSLRGLSFRLRGLIFGLRVLILGLRGIIWGLRWFSGDGQTFRNSPLCPAGHWPFGATAKIVSKTFFFPHFDSLIKDQWTDGPMEGQSLFPSLVFATRNSFTVEIQYNGPQGTEEFWLLNPNVVKSNC